MGYCDKNVTITFDSLGNADRFIKKWEIDYYVLNAETIDKRIEELEAELEIIKNLRRGKK